MSELIDIEIKPSRCGNGDTKLIVHNLMALDARATAVLEMITKWGTIAGEPDGEDSAGRQKLKSVDEFSTVERACTLVEEAFSQFEKRNWSEPLPDMFTRSQMFAAEDKKAIK